MSDITGSYADLTAEQREKLAAYLTLRNEYLPAQIELNRRRIAVLTNYSPAEEAAIQEYSATVVAPLRLKFSQSWIELLKDSVDVKAMESMLPMVLMVLTQSINVPMLLTTLGLEPDSIDQLTHGLSSYFKKGM
jgi:hypothetical protein